MNIEQFEAYRPLLFSIAYRMLGTVSDAEDVLQDAFLRVQRRTEGIDNPKYYLTTVVTRLCLNHLSRAKTQREQYVGPWLPEPLPTADNTPVPTPAQQATTYDAISIAFLVLLESLSPAERAVLLLHEVFGYSHKEIAAIVGKSEVACRQLLRRAKRHVAENKPRFEASPQQHERLLRGFIEVVELGEIDAFLQLLAEDVTFVPDGGGERGAAVRVLHGPEAVARFILGVQRTAPANLRYELAWLNGEQALLARTVKDRPFFALFITSDGEQVRLMHVIAGQKLSALVKNVDQ